MKFTDIVRVLTQVRIYHQLYIEKFIITFEMVPLMFLIEPIVSECRNAEGKFEASIY